MPAAAPLPDRLRSLRARCVAEGRRGFRVRLPGDSTSVCRSVHGSLVDALDEARVAGATVCTVYESATLPDGTTCHLACREWLLGWRLVPPLPRSGGDGGA